MKNVIRIAAGSIVVWFLVCGNSLVAQGTDSVRFHQISDQILNNLFKFLPVLATDKGIHSYDDRLADYSPAAINKEINILKGFLADLKKINPEKLLLPDQLDYKLLTSNVESLWLDFARIQWHKKSPVVYVNECLNGVYFILLRENALMSERLKAIAERLREVPRVLAQGQKNIANPPAIYVEIAQEAAQEAINFYQQAIVDLASLYPASKPAIDSAVPIAVEAFKNYVRYLEKLEKTAQGNFAIGKEYFNYKLKHEHFLDFDSDSLLKIGQTILADVAQEYRRLQAHLDSFPPPQEEYFVPQSYSLKDHLEYYQWEMDQTKQYLRDKNIVTVPDPFPPCVAVSTPKFMRGLIPGIAYQPTAPFDTNQTGYFYIPFPDSFNDQQRARYYGSMRSRRIKGGVVHEAYPGHHFQMTFANRVPSRVRKIQANNTMAEGWALYCEQMMYDQGFYGEDLRQKLGVLGGIRFRACRIVVDVSLHTGKMGFQQAVDYMAKTLGSDTAFVKAEVKRYTIDPTQPMSYLTGKLIIMDMREKMKARAGVNFSLKKFHDLILAEGTIPPSLIRWKLAKEGNL